ncbi:MAG: sulfurtransferase TusA family protein [Desulfuromonadales bacterium]|nr:sulfurtransferase TusA family protein [Desulfuromonadales bacterium]
MDNQRLELDIRGQICPSTLLTALRTIAMHREPLRSGQQVLAIRTDNRDATATIPAAARNMGYHVEVEKEDGAYLILIGGEASLPSGCWP